MYKTTSKMNSNGRLSESTSRVVSDEIFKKFKNKTFLITGATGFIVRYLVYTIIQQNDTLNTNNKLILLVRNSQKAKMLYPDLLLRGDIVFIEGDVCNELIIEENINYIIHAAGQSNPVNIDNDPVGTFNANMIGTDNMLRLAYQKKCEAVLYVSSYMVYGGSINTENVTKPYLTPIDFQDAKNCYAEAKRAGEMLCACYQKQYGIPIKIIRPSFIFGSSDAWDKRVWSEIIRNVSNNVDITLNSDGINMRAVCYVLDVVVAMLYVLLKGETCYGYNVESQITTIREFAELAVKYENTSSKLLYKNKVDEIVDESKLVVPENMKCFQNAPLLDLGWKPKWLLNEAIYDAIEIEREKEE